MNSEDWVVYNARKKHRSQNLQVAFSSHTEKNRQPILWQEYYIESSWRGLLNHMLSLQFKRAHTVLKIKKKPENGGMVGFRKCLGIAKPIWSLSACCVYSNCGSHLKTVMQQKWKQFIKNHYSALILLKSLGLAWVLQRSLKGASNQELEVTNARSQ